MIGADMQMPLGIAHVRRDPVDDACRLEQAHHLMVEMHRARQRTGAGFLFDDQHRKTAFPKEIGRKGPTGPQPIIAASDMIGSSF
jgi:hypothetical protein